MSQDAKATRPGQATFAGWLIIGGSVILVMTAWERISGLHTMEVRDDLRAVLAEPPFSGTGMELSDLVTLVRIGSMVAAAAATAAAVLGFQALKRSTSARLALTFLAPVVLVGGFATAGFFAPLVVAGVVMLWLSPTREWFAGRPWVNKMVPPTADDSRNDVQRRDSNQPHADWPDPNLPDPFSKPEQDPTRSPSEPSAEADRPAAVSGYGSTTTYAVPPRRPAALVWACGLVWVMSGLVSGMMVLLALVLAVARDDFFAEVERQQPDFDFQGLSHSEIAAGVFATTGLVVLWSVAAVVLAILAFRGANWARIALLASSVAVGAVTLASAFASPPMLVVTGAAAVTIWLLMRPDVLSWFRR